MEKARVGAREARESCRESSSGQQRTTDDTHDRNRMQAAGGCKAQAARGERAGARKRAWSNSPRGPRPDASKPLRKPLSSTIKV